MNFQSIMASGEAFISDLNNGLIKDFGIICLSILRKDMENQL